MTLVAIAVQNGQIELRGEDSRASGRASATRADHDFPPVDAQAGRDRQRIPLVP